jgi:hypothetical protein
MKLEIDDDRVFDMNGICITRDLIIKIVSALSDGGSVAVVNAGPSAVARFNTEAAFRIYDYCEERLRENASPRTGWWERLWCRMFGTS